MSYVTHVFGKESIDQITYEDVKRLIDIQFEEFLHLDYETIPSEKKFSVEGLSQHISGFLNSSGGIIVFGLSEQEIG
jgi:hypothetical protein